MAEIIDSLVRAYRNEKGTRELLPYEHRLMVSLGEKIPKQIEFVTNIQCSSVLKCIYEQDLERTMYFMREYILSRMRKINENFSIDRNMMSEAEKRYHDELMDFYKGEDILAETEWKNNEFVGFISLVENDGVVLDGNVVPMRANEFFIANIKDVIEMVKRGEAMLV